MTSGYGFDRDGAKRIVKQVRRLERQAAQPPESSRRDYIEETAIGCISSLGSTSVGSQEVRVYGFKFRLAVFEKAVGKQTITGKERSDTEFFAAAPIGLSLAMDDVVSLIKRHDRWWIVDKYATDCVSSSSASSGSPSSGSSESSNPSSGSSETPSSGSSESSGSDDSSGSSDTPSSSGSSGSSDTSSGSSDTPSSSDTSDTSSSSSSCECGGVRWVWLAGEWGQAFPTPGNPNTCDGTPVPPDFDGEYEGHGVTVCCDCTSSSSDTSSGSPSSGSDTSSGSSVSSGSGSSDSSGSSGSGESSGSDTSSGSSISSGSSDSSGSSGSGESSGSDTSSGSSISSGSDTSSGSSDSSSSDSSGSSSATSSSSDSSTAPCVTIPGVDLDSLPVETEPDYVLGIKDGCLVKVPVSQCPSSSGSA